MCFINLLLCARVLVFAGHTHLDNFDRIFFKGQGPLAKIGVTNELTGGFEGTCQGPGCISTFRFRPLAAFTMIIAHSSAVIIFLVYIAQPAATRGFPSWSNKRSWNSVTTQFGKITVTLTPLLLRLPSFWEKPRWFLKHLFSLIGLKHHENFAMQWNITWGKQIASKNNSVPLTWQRSNDTTCFFNTWDNCGAIPWFHKRVYGCMDPASAHQGVL
jgi:hypothetical protein